MSGELQTIPARHGVATFVPRGRTIKIINTYGKQVVSTWAFSLAAPPEESQLEEDENLGEEEIEEKTEALKREIVHEDVKEKEKGVAEDEGSTEDAGKDLEGAKTTTETKPTEEAGPVTEDPPEQAPDSLENEAKQPEKRTWSSYIPSMPSIPYRSKGTSGQPGTTIDTEAEKAQNEATSKKWSSYLPTGKSFSSYVPNVQLPDSKGVASAFKSSHYLDPNKSYAEQLYDFSKTPVGAGGLAAATGGGTASSLYAAYNAYSKTSPRASQPPMEFLSLPHTRAALHRLVPQVGDTLVTNLCAPIITLIEDTTPGAHDTLMAACSSDFYAALGVDRPEEHGSCAENLVLALKELNEKVGLKGAKAVGADVTVYVAPTPMHLFMNAVIERDAGGEGEGAGAKGATVRVEEPKGAKRGYVRFRAERDVVVVMSACPMDVGPQNGGRPMAANFMVEDAAEEDLAKSVGSVTESKATKDKPNETLASPSPKSEAAASKKAQASPLASPKSEQEVPKPTGKPRLKGGPAKPAAVKKSAEEAVRRDSAIEPAEADVKKKGVKSPQTIAEDPPKPKKKPKKLERRSPTTPSAAS